MMSRRFAVTVFTIVALAASQSRLAAQEERSRSKGTHDGRLEALLNKLSLNDNQKAEVHKIQANFEKKQEPLEKQIWTLHHEESAAMRDALTPEQRQKLPQIMRAAWDKELNRVADKLNLSDEQKQQAKKIREEYTPKFHALMAKSAADSFQQFCELRKEARKEFNQVLNAEQRAMLPGIIREEFHRWHDTNARRELLKDLGDKLGVSNEERVKLQTIMAEYNPKMDKETAQFKQLYQEEHAAIERVLTAEQRTKLQELQKTKGD